MGQAVIVEAVRSPIGRKNGAFRETRPDDLYAAVLDALIERSGIDPAKIEDVVSGCVVNIGEQGMNMGRGAVLLSQKFPITVPATTLNRMCGSAQQAIHFVSQAIDAGDMQYGVAGGAESMNRMPMGGDLVVNGEMKINQRFLEKYGMVPMGEASEMIAQKYGFSRRDLDEFSFESHKRAAAAIKNGYQRSQIAPMEGLTKEGQKFVLDRDEGVRLEPSLESMMSLPPSFRTDGVTTAGNSSQISDGAAAVLIADKDVAKADGFRPRAKFLARVVVGGDPIIQLLEPANATKAALKKAKLSLKDIDIIEINEAFASVVLAWAREINPDMDKVNVNGGAIAHGHPLGATGAILMTKLVNELERRDATLGLQVMCTAQGMATCTIIERI